MRWSSNTVKLPLMTICIGFPVTLLRVLKFKWKSVILALTSLFEVYFVTLCHIKLMWFLLWFLGWSICCCGHSSHASSEDPRLCYQSWSSNKQSLRSPASSQLDRHGCVPYLWTLGEEGREPEPSRTFWERSTAWRQWTSDVELIACYSSSNYSVEASSVDWFSSDFLAWFYLMRDSAMVEQVAVFLLSFIWTVFGLFLSSDAECFSFRRLLGVVFCARLTIPVDWGTSRIECEESDFLHSVLCAFFFLKSLC